MRLKSTVPKMSMFVTQSIKQSKNPRKSQPRSCSRWEEDWEDFWGECRMKIFSGSSNKPLAEKIARDLNLTLSPVEEFIFPDGERRVRIVEDVVEESAVIVLPTSTPVDQH